MDRREFIAGVAGLGLALSVGESLIYAKNSGAPDTYPYQLPQLPYGYSALEPHIDARTMEIHHSKHHDAYVKKLNEALAKFSDAANKNLYSLMANIKTLPKELQNPVRNNAGGHFNHTFFWEQFVPDATASLKQTALENQIIQQYGSLQELKNAFNKAAATVFGSGWVWLVKRQNNTLGILTTPNQDNPLMDVADTQVPPILGLDVWEHAYYLKYQNRRADYCNAFWEVLNWGVIAKRFEK